MRRSILALSAAAVACARGAAAPSPRPTPTPPAPSASSSPQPEPPRRNEVLRRIIDGGEVYARLASCEALGVAAGKDPDERALEIDVSPPLGCAAKRKVGMMIDVRDPHRLRCTGTRSQVGRALTATVCALDAPAPANESPSSGELVLEGVRLFSDRSACEAAPAGTMPGAPTCLRTQLAAAVAERQDEIPSGEHVTRLEALLADPNAKVWHRIDDRGSCVEYGVQTSGTSFKFVRNWTDKKASHSDESSFTYDAKCKQVAYGGSSSSFTSTDGHGVGHGLRMNGSPAAPIAAVDRQPDLLPFHPQAWFYTRRACERSER